MAADCGVWATCGVAYGDRAALEGEPRRCPTTTVMGAPADMASTMGSGMCRQTGTVGGAAPGDADRGGTHGAAVLGAARAGGALHAGGRSTGDNDLGCVGLGGIKCKWHNG